MKKLASLLLVLAVFLSLGTTALAADTTSTQSTKLTTTVPAATYVLNIPADQAVDFGTTDVNIGNVTVTDSSGFAQGKNVEVSVSYTAFTSEDVETGIPFYSITLQGSSNSGGTETTRYKDLSVNSNKMTFLGNSTGKVGTKAFVEDGYESSSERGSVYDFYVNNLKAYIRSTDWGKALAGDYSATITFSASVVVEA